MFPSPLLHLFKDFKDINCLTVLSAFSIISITLNENSPISLTYSSLEELPPVTFSWRAILWLSILLGVWTPKRPYVSIQLHSQCPYLE